MTSDVNIVNVSDTSSFSDNLSFSTSHYCGNWCNHSSTWYPYWSYGTTTIYKYQVKCPRCKIFNWLELDKIIPCTKCSANLKAVALKADYEVEVG